MSRNAIASGMGCGYVVLLAVVAYEPVMLGRRLEMPAGALQARWPACISQTTTIMIAKEFRVGLKGM